MNWDELSAQERLLAEHAVMNRRALRQAWTEAARQTLLRDGWSGIEACLQSERVSRTDAERTELDALRNYLAPHQLHRNSAERLRAGRSIGSGRIEGACKNLIGRRLKANAARWRVRRVNRMAGLCFRLYSNQWDTYWKSARKPRYPKSALTPLRGQCRISNCNSSQGVRQLLLSSHAEYPCSYPDPGQNAFALAALDRTRRADATLLAR